MPTFEAVAAGRRLSARHWQSMAVHTAVYCGIQHSVLCQWQPMQGPVHWPNAVASLWRVCSRCRLCRSTTCIPIECNGSAQADRHIHWQIKSAIRFFVRRSCLVVLPGKPRYIPLSSGLIALYKMPSSVLLNLARPLAKELVGLVRVLAQWLIMDRDGGALGAVWPLLAPSLRTHVSVPGWDSVRCPGGASIVCRCSSQYISAALSSSMVSHSRAESSAHCLIILAIVTAAHTPMYTD